jgi:hypothetical protein
LPLKPKPSRHRFEKPIHNVKKHDPRKDRYCSYRADLGASSSGYLGWRMVPAAPSVAAKLRLVARFSALAVLAERAN